jgi:FimV-like protein
VETAAPSVQSEPPASGRRVYQVREGDGLWSIAQQFQPAGVGENIYQMLLSLHDLNRAAFINGNISLLKANALLQIPDADDINAVVAGTAEERFEQRWDEGTVRLQTALRGDPLPAFSNLYDEGNIEAGPQAELERRAPGEETGRVTPGGNGLLLPATTPIVVPISGMQAEPDGGDLLLGEQGSQEVSAASPGTAGTVPQSIAASDATAPQDATVNPYLERINSSTRELQALLQNRSVQIASLETQLVEMRQRMRDAQQVTARLNAALEQALEQRNAQQSAASRNTSALAVVALVLLVAVLGAMVMLLKLTAQLRSQRLLLDEQGDFPDSLDNVGPVGTRASGERQAAVFAAQAGQETGIIVEEATMAATADDEGLQQELLEIIGPAMEGEPDSQHHGRNQE